MQLLITLWSDLIIINSYTEALLNCGAFYVPSFISHRLASFSIAKIGIPAGYRIFTPISTLYRLSVLSPWNLPSVLNAIKFYCISTS